jgi:hypothetical protein
MNIRLITRMMMLATASVTASSVLMAAAQAEAKKARAAALFSARAEVPAPTLVPALAQSQPSAMRYLGGPKSPISVVGRCVGCRQPVFAACPRAHHQVYGGAGFSERITAAPWRTCMPMRGELADPQAPIVEISKPRR